MVGEEIAFVSRIIAWKYLNGDNLPTKDGDHTAIIRDTHEAQFISRGESSLGTLVPGDTYPKSLQFCETDS